MEPEIRLDKAKKVIYVTLPQGYKARLSHQNPEDYALNVVGISHCECEVRTVLELLEERPTKRKES